MSWLPKYDTENTVSESICIIMQAPSGQEFLHLFYSRLIIYTQQKSSRLFIKIHIRILLNNLNFKTFYIYIFLMPF